MYAWEQFLQQQETELGFETVQKWLRSLKVQRFDACHLYLEAKDSFQALWFEEHMRSKVKLKLINSNNKKIKVHIALADAQPTAKKTIRNFHTFKNFNLNTFTISFDELNPLCTFDNFLFHQDNQLLAKFLSEIAEATHSITNTATSINPIYIYGIAGSGKTHLLMSLAHTFKNRNLKTIYARAETFTDHVVTAIRSSAMGAFRQAYRNTDVLLIDDVHIFARKWATQEEFFHIFNTFHLEGKQIIITANCAPQALQFIEPRLISRFEWGIALPLPPLPTEEQYTMLEKKAKLLNFQLPSDVADLLINTFISNTKALIKALEAIVLRSHLNNSTTALNVTIAKTLLADLMIEEQKMVITPTKIVQSVAQHFDINIKDILGRTQKKECSLPRKLAMYLCRKKLNIPFMQIGDFFSRDHSTVITSIKYIHDSLAGHDHQELISDCHAIVKKLHEL